MLVTCKSGYVRSRIKVTHIQLVKHRFDNGLKAFQMHYLIVMVDCMSKPWMSYLRNSAMPQLMPIGAANQR
jgi:hypothetical protein